MLYIWARQRVKGGLRVEPQGRTAAAAGSDGEGQRPVAVWTGRGGQRDAIVGGGV